MTVSTTTRHATETQKPATRWSYTHAVEVIAQFVRGQGASKAEAERALAYLDRKFMKVGDVQRTLGIKSPTTIKKWIGQGVFPGAYRQSGGQWLIPAERVYSLRDASIRADRMNAAGKIEQEVYEGDDLFADLGL